MNQTNFEKLDVYKLSEKLCDLIWEIVINWESLSKNTLGSQMIRSSDSIGANIAEGTGRGSSKENKRFAKIARGSLYETKHWLRRAVKRNLLSKKQIDELKVIIDELSPRLSAYINSIRDNKQLTTNN
ncbi:MAG: four helix bundle protein [Ignavibacteriales bacterium]|nr:four helix bundle protein [Ignavibacteriales bacterium]